MLHCLRGNGRPCKGTTKYMENNVVKRSLRGDGVMVTRRNLHRSTLARQEQHRRKKRTRRNSRITKYSENRVNEAKKHLQRTELRSSEDVDRPDRYQGRPSPLRP